MLFRALTYVHDPIHRHLIDDFDADEQRTWCFVQYSPAFKIFNSFITLFHFIVFPFSINFISGIAIIVSMARTRTNANNKTSFKQNLRLQLHQHKHLLGVPRLVFTFFTSCMKKAREPWFYLLAIFLNLLIIAYNQINQCYSQKFSF
jgi:L-asparagine transporter-like permease